MFCARVPDDDVDDDVHVSCWILKVGFNVVFALYMMGDMEEFELWMSMAGWSFM